MSKYKYSLNSVIKAMTEFQIKMYPMYCKQLEAAKAEMIPSATPRYEKKEGSGGFNSEQRPTEDITMKIVSSMHIKHLEETVIAVGAVIDLLDAENKELIRLRYWNGALTPEGIADRMHLGRTTVYERLNNILVEVALKLGYIDL